MPGAFDQQIDQKQAEVNKLKDQQENQDLKKIIEQNTDAFMSSVDQFQHLEESMKLNTPQAKAYLAKGKQKILSALNSVAARGKMILDKNSATKTEKKDGQRRTDVSGVEAIDKEAFNLKETLNTYQENLKTIVAVEAKYQQVQIKMEELAKEETKSLKDREKSKDGMLGKYQEAFAEVCNLFALKNRSTQLPAEFLQAINLVKGKTCEQLIQQLQSKVVEANEQKLIKDRFNKYITISANGEKTYTSEWETLSEIEKNKILLEIANVKLEVDEQVQEKIRPPALDNFFAAKKLYKLGSYEEARKLFKQFLDHDRNLLVGTSAAKKEKEYVETATSVLAELDLLLDVNADLFKAQKLIETGDLTSAKNVLKNFIKGSNADRKVLKDETHELKMIETAKELLKRIALTELNQIKIEFDQIPQPSRVPKSKVEVAGYQVDWQDAVRRAGSTYGQPVGGAAPEQKTNPDYVAWEKYGEALKQAEQAIASGQVPDFKAAYDKFLAPLKNLEEIKSEFAKKMEDSSFDQLALQNGREGMLFLARKYRSESNYTKADKFFSMYFADKLQEGDNGKPKITYEEIVKKYGGTFKESLALAPKMNEAKAEYDKKCQEDKNYEKLHPWKEDQIRAKFQQEYLTSVWKEEILHATNAKIPSSIQNNTEEFEAWKEYMALKGQQWQGTWTENFGVSGISDATRDRLIREIPIQIALLALSGGIASLGRAGVMAAGEAVSSLLVREAGSLAFGEATSMGVSASGLLAEQALARLGISAANAAAYGRGGAMLASEVFGLLAVESPIFVLTDSTLNGVLTGNYKVTNLETFCEEWRTAALTMGVLGSSGRLMRALKFAEGAGKMSGLIKGVNGTNALAAEIASMGALEGAQGKDLSADDLAMILGLKIGHAAAEAPKKIDAALKDFNARKIEKFNADALALDGRINELEWQIAIARAKESTDLPQLEKQLGQLVDKLAPKKKAIFQNIENELTKQVGEVRQLNAKLKEAFDTAKEPQRSQLASQIVEGGQYINALMHDIEGFRAAKKAIDNASAGSGVESGKKGVKTNKSVPKGDGSSTPKAGNDTPKNSSRNPTLPEEVSHYEAAGSNPTVYGTRVGRYVPGQGFVSEAPVTAARVGEQVSLAGKTLIAVKSHHDFPTYFVSELRLFVDRNGVVVEPPKPVEKAAATGAPTEVSPTAEAGPKFEVGKPLDYSLVSKQKVEGMVIDGKAYRYYRKLNVYTDAKGIVVEPPVEKPTAATGAPTEVNGPLRQIPVGTEIPPDMLKGKLVFGVTSHNGERLLYYPGYNLYIRNGVVVEPPLETKAAPKATPTTVPSTNEGPTYAVGDTVDIKFVTSYASEGFRGTDIRYFKNFDIYVDITTLKVVEPPKELKELIEAKAPKEAKAQEATPTAAVEPEPFHIGTKLDPKIYQKERAMRAYGELGERLLYFAKFNVYVDSEGFIVEPPRLKSFVQTGLIGNEGPIIYHKRTNDFYSNGQKVTLTPEQKVRLVESGLWDKLFKL